jgi:hypothetical protein
MMHRCLMPRRDAARVADARLRRPVEGLRPFLFARSAGRVRRASGAGTLPAAPGESFSRENQQ